jgi:hypothetical protein
VDMVDECLAPSYDWRRFLSSQFYEFIGAFMFVLVVAQLYLYDIFVLDVFLMQSVPTTYDCVV